jgi:hypothetical protein
MRKLMSSDLLSVCARACLRVCVFFVHTAISSIVEAVPTNFGTSLLLENRWQPFENLNYLCDSSQNDTPTCISNVSSV